MKKQLMTTTALVAAGLIAATGPAIAQSKDQRSGNALQLYLGGQQEFVLGGVDNDSQVRSNTGFDVQHDGEIHFKSSATLDNGLKIRTRVELESFTSTDQIDEAYIDVSGRWGAVRVGSEDNAAHLMVTPTFGAWATNVAQNTNFDVTDWAIVPKDFVLNGTQRLELGEGDSEKITYFTPRIAGLQLGVSYMPSGEEDRNSSVSPAGPDIVEGFAVATNYRGKFGGVGIGVGAGYAQAHQPESATGTENQEGDPKAWNVGGKISFSGVTLAAGYMTRKSITDGSDGASSKSSDEVSFGAKYDFGKNHVSAGYLYGEAENRRAIRGEDEASRLMVSYRRDLAKGVQYRLSFIYADFDGEQVGNVDNNEAVGLTTGIRIAF